MRRFRRIVTEVEAFRFKLPLGDEFPNLAIHKKSTNEGGNPDGEWEVETCTGPATLSVGDWLIREPSDRHRFYPIDDETFRNLYELVDDPTQGS